MNTENCLNSSTPIKWHYVYCLYFDQTRVDPAVKPELFSQINRIREYGYTIPTDPEIVFYVGETTRKSARHSEHQHEPHNPNHQTYDYSSRRMIRLLDEYNVNWEFSILSKFPVGEPVTDFEHHFFCQLAALDMPLTNMAKTLDSPSVPRLAQAETIEEYRVIKNQIAAEGAAKKRRRSCKPSRTRIIWPCNSLPSQEQQEKISQQISAHFTDLANRLHNGPAKTFCHKVAYDPNPYLWQQKKIDKHIISVNEMMRLIKLAITNELYQAPSC